MGIELVEDRQSKIPASVERVTDIILACKSKGLLVGKNGDTVPGYANIVTLSPPLSSTDEDVNFIIETLLSVFGINEEQEQVLEKG
ncbi:Taurine--pyruvate aminotransferase [compost metagenome]